MYVCVHVYALYVHMCVQLRRQARLRREYLYRKSVEDKERSVLERKRKIQDSITGKHVLYMHGFMKGERWDRCGVGSEDHSVCLSSPAPSFISLFLFVSFILAFHFYLLFIFAMYICIFNIPSFSFSHFTSFLNF